MQFTFKIANLSLFLFKKSKMKKVIDQLFKMSPAQIVWKEAEASLLKTLPNQDRESFFKTIDLFSKQEQGSDEFWRMLEPYSLKYIENHTQGDPLEGYEIELLMDGFIGSDIIIQNPEFEEKLMNLSMDYADEKIQTDDEEFVKQNQMTEAFISQMGKNKDKESGENQQVWIDKTDVKVLEEFVLTKRFINEEKKELLLNQTKLVKQYSK